MEFHLVPTVGSISFSKPYMYMYFEHIVLSLINFFIIIFSVVKWSYGYVLYVLALFLYKIIIKNIQISPYRSFL